MMGWYDGGWSYGWMALMMIGWLVLLVAAGWAVVALTRSGNGPAADSQRTPQDVLDRRFAAGEIGPQEYAEARRLLRSGGPRGPQEGDAWSS